MTAFFSQKNTPLAGQEQSKTPAHSPHLCTRKTDTLHGVRKDVCNKKFMNNATFVDAKSSKNLGGGELAQVSKSGIRLLNYLDAICPKDYFLVARRWGPLNPKDPGCSKWLTWKEWKTTRVRLPNYRRVLPNEIVLETDFPKRETNKLVADKLMQILREKGYGYRCYFSGNKSYHIHLFFTNIEVKE